MKRVISIIFVFLLNVCGFSQELNHKGLKMVKRIEFCKGWSKPYYTISFEYNKDKQLSCIIKNSLICIDSCKREGNRLIRKKYKFDKIINDKPIGKRLDREYSYTYKLNNDGYITYIDARCISYRNDIFSERYKLEYNEWNKLLYKIECQNYTKYYNKKDYCKLSDKNTYLFDYEGENSYCVCESTGINRGMLKTERHEKYYKDKINDTNIDFSFIDDYYTTSDVFNILMTEWVNNRSKYLYKGDWFMKAPRTCPKCKGNNIQLSYDEPEYSCKDCGFKRNNSWLNKYVYHYDNNGNITEINVYHNDRWQKTIKIYY